MLRTISGNLRGRDPRLIEIVKLRRHLSVHVAGLLQALISLMSVNGNLKRTRKSLCRPLMYENFRSELVLFEEEKK